MSALSRHNVSVSGRPDGQPIVESVQGAAGQPAVDHVRRATTLALFLSVLVFVGAGYIALETGEGTRLLVVNFGVDHEVAPVSEPPVLRKSGLS